MQINGYNDLRLGDWAWSDTVSSMKIGAEVLANLCIDDYCYRSDETSMSMDIVGPYNIRELKNGWQDSIS